MWKFESVSSARGLVRWNFEGVLIFGVGVVVFYRFGNSVFTLGRWCEGVYEVDVG